jgi:hypothetical protein
MEPVMSLDRFDCYELCVQSPRHITALLHGIAARDGVEPMLLREDFCGSAAVSRRWIEEAMGVAETHAWRGRLALAIDLEAQALDRARRFANVGAEWNGRIEFLQGDCTAKDAPAGDRRADIVFVGNFSIGYCHARTTLMRYLRYSLSRLKDSGGIFACDLYGGPGAFSLGQLRRRHPSKGRETIHYLWSHDEADAMTGMVTNSITFEIERDGEIIEQIPKAFVYRWRLWSLPELREAMLEVGFKSFEVYTDVNVAPREAPTPVECADELRGDWVAMVAGRA